MTKARRITCWILALVVFTMQVLSGGITGKMVMEAAEVTPESVSLSTYDIWAANAKWISAPLDGNWNLAPNELYDYSSNALSVDLTSLPKTSVKGIKFGDKGSGSAFQYYETVATLPAGVYKLSTMLMGKDAQLTLFLGDESASSACAATGWNEWQTADATFTVAEDKTDVKVGFKLDVTASGWGYIDQLYISGEKINSTQSNTFTLYYYSESSDPLYVNIWKWTGLEFGSGAQTGKEFGWTYPQATMTAVKGKTNWYSTEFKILDSTKTEEGFTIYQGSDSNNICEYSASYSNTADYAKMLSGASKSYAVKDFTLYTSIEEAEAAGSGGTGTGTDTGTAVSGELNVTKVNNLSKDFIMGMDISSVISLFDSGVTFKDWNGKKISNVTDFCKFLASNGITHIRVRVWNNPYDSNGKGYGGGNNDVAKAKKIADACEAAGIHVMVDFHCSDLWTDPGKQFAPKAWKNYSVSEKAEALQKFIYDSLNTIDPNKNTVDMVQVGNETTGGFIGETSVENMCTLFKAGSAGVKSFNAGTKVVIHVTNPEKGNVTKWAKNLSDNSVNYDIIATSYYPYWHGTLANLKSEFQTVKSTYKKDVMVAETSYAYTLEDSDGHDNTVRKGNNDTGGYITEPFTVQGQATSIRNLINTVSEAGGLGVFYWEPAWLTVGNTTGLSGDAYDRQVAANRQKWETYGSGWASSYASEYDPEDAGKWYGGSAVDNEAMFYPDGTPTAGLRVWEYVKTGAISNLVSVDDITNPEETIYQGESYRLPSTVSVAYSTGTIAESVTWAASASKKIDANAAGTTYIVSGTVHFSKAVTSGQYKGKTSAPVTYTLKVNAKNLIEDAEDAGFEKGGNFTIGGEGIDLPSTSDPYAGKKSMHWYKDSAAEGTVTYNPVITLAAGEYVFEAVAQGFAGDIVSLQILDTDNQVLYAGKDMKLDGWANWKRPTVSFTLTETTDVKVRVVVNMQAGGWGTADELFLHVPAREKVVNIGGSTASGSGSSGGISGGSGTPGSGTDKPDTTITQNPDGTTTETTVDEAVNSAGNKVEVTTSVTKEEDGSVIGTKVVTVIENAAKNTSAVVTVSRDADGKVTEAVADVTKTGIGEATGTKVTISGAVTAQVKEAAGTDVMITTIVTDSKGEEKYTVTVNSKDLVTGNKLQVVAVDPDTGEYVLVSAKTYTVNQKENVTVTLADGKEYVFLNDKDAKRVSDNVLKTVKVKKSTATVKAGKKMRIKLSSKLNMNNVKKVTYASSNKEAATVNKKGRVTAKKAGTVTIKAKVTLNNGKTKTVAMKVKVKK